MKLIPAESTSQSFKITREIIEAFNTSVNYTPPEAAQDERLTARGMLAASLLTQMLDDELEGEYVFLTQSFKFRAPVFEGDTVTAVLTVTSTGNEEIGLSFLLKNQHGNEVLMGVATTQVRAGVEA